MSKSSIQQRRQYICEIGYKSGIWMDFPLCRKSSRLALNQNFKSYPSSMSSKLHTYMHSTSWNKIIHPVWGVRPLFVMSAQLAGLSQRTPQAQFSSCCRGASIFADFGRCLALRAVLSRDSITSPGQIVDFVTWVSLIFSSEEKLSTGD